MIQERGLYRGRRMQVVGLKGVALAGNRLKQERQEGHFFALCNIGEDSGEAHGIVHAVIGGKFHSDQQHLAFLLAGAAHHLQKVVMHCVRGQSAQSIVGAQFKDDNGWLVLA